MDLLDDLIDHGQVFPETAQCEIGVLFELILEVLFENVHPLVSQANLVEQPKQRS